MCTFSFLFVFLGTILGLLASLIAIWQFIEERRRKAISWRRIDKIVRELVAEVEHSTFTPDLIVGIGRGGTLVAAMLATNMEGRIELACIDTEAEWDVTGRKHVRLRSPEHHPDLEGRHVLLVVAELYSGQDMRDAINELESLGAAELRTLAVLSGPSTNFRPAFVGCQTKHEPVAPWRLTNAARKGGGRI